MGAAGTLAWVAWRAGGVSPTCNGAGGTAASGETLGSNDAVCSGAAIGSVCRISVGSGSGFGGAGWFTDPSRRGWPGATLRPDAWLNF